jgi:hypothetical protein
MLLMTVVISIIALVVVIRFAMHAVKIMESVLGLLESGV